MVHAHYSQLTYQLTSFSTCKTSDFDVIRSYVRAENIIKEQRHIELIKTHAVLSGQREAMQLIREVTDKHV